MSKQIFITTTGTTSPVSFRDLGGRSFSHPTTNFELTTEYKIETIRDSLDFFSAITSGYITVKDEYDISILVQADMFPIFRTDPILSIKNMVAVNKEPGYGEFLTIKEAIDYINAQGDASATNGYTIRLGNGVFLEEELTLPSYTYIVGISQENCIFGPDTSNHNIINLSNLSGIYNCTLKDAGTGYVAVNCVNVGDWAMLHKVTVNNSDTGCLFSTTSIDSYAYLEYVDFSDCITNSIKITNTTTYAMSVNCENLFIQYYGTDPANSLIIDGTNSECVIQGGKFIGSGTLLGNAIRVTNGGYINFSSGQIEDWAIAAYVDSTGTSPYLKLQAIDFDDNTYNIYVDNNTCSGFYAGDYDRAKIIINENCEFYVANQDQRIITVAKKGG
jgi:hypothetical protein